MSAERSPAADALELIGKQAVDAAREELITSSVTLYEESQRAIGQSYTEQETYRIARRRFDQAVRDLAKAEGRRLYEHRPTWTDEDKS